MHMVAAWWTPELPESWIKYQFDRLGGDGEKCILTVKRYAYNKECRARWQHLGQQNLLFMGHDEVIRYYHRRNKNKNAWHPNWALPVMADLIKSGMTYEAVGELLQGFNKTQIWLLVNRRNMFEPHLKYKGDPNLNKTRFKKG